MWAPENFMGDSSVMLEWNELMNNINRDPAHKWSPPDTRETSWLDLDSDDSDDEDDETYELEATDCPCLDENDTVPTDEIYELSSSPVRGPSSDSDSDDEFFTPDPRQKYDPGSDDDFSTPEPDIIRISTPTTMIKQPSVGEMGKGVHQMAWSRLMSFVGSMFW